MDRLEVGWAVDNLDKYLDGLVEISVWGCTVLVCLCCSRKQCRSGEGAMC